MSVPLARTREAIRSHIPFLADVESALLQGQTVDEVGFWESVRAAEAAPFRFAGDVAGNTLRTAGSALGEGIGAAASGLGEGLGAGLGAAASGVGRGVGSGLGEVVKDLWPVLLVVGLLLVVLVVGALLLGAKKTQIVRSIAG